VLGAISKLFEAGIENNGKRYRVEIISKDSQSNPNQRKWFTEATDNNGL